MIGWWIGCSQEATQAGGLGAWDIPSEHPRPPLTDLAGEVSDEVCETRAGAGAEVRVRWSGWTAGEDRHLARVEVELVRPGEHLVVTASPPERPGGESLEPGAPWADVLDLRFTCDRDGWVDGRWVTQRGVDTVRVTTR